MDKYWSFATRLIFLILLIIGSIWFLNSIAWVVGLILISTLIVYILFPVLNYLKKKFKMRHILATVIVFVVFLMFCLIMIGLLIPVFYIELNELADNFPHYLVRVQDFIAWVTQQTIDFDLEEEVRSYLVGLTDNLHQAVEYLADASMSLIGGAVGFFIVLFLVFYLLNDFHSVRNELVALFPMSNRPIVERLLAIVDENVGTFVRGSLVRCVIVGIVTGIVVYIIGMPYALLLGLLAGIFNFILYIGPYIAAVPAVLLSLSPLTPSPLIVILVYVVIQIMDGMFLAPLILGRIVKLKPITVIVAILVGGSLAGIIGMVLAVPVAGITKGILDLIKESAAYQSEPSGVEGE